MSLRQNRQQARQWKEKISTERSHTKIDTERWTRKCRKDRSFWKERPKGKIPESETPHPTHRKFALITNHGAKYWRAGVFFCVRSSKTESLIFPNLTVSDVCLALLKRTNRSSYNNIHDEWLMPLNLKNVCKIRWSCDVPGWFFHIDSKQREILVTGNINHLKTHSSESTSAKTWDYKKRTCILTKSLP